MNINVAMKNGFIRMTRFGLVGFGFGCIHYWPSNGAGTMIRYFQLINRSVGYLTAVKNVFIRNRRFGLVGKVTDSVHFGP